MARYSFEESENYSGSSVPYFNLKDDRESAKIRILINDINDLYGVSCHQVTIGDRQVDIECLRSYNEPVSKCPLCQAGYGVNAKLFIPIYNETTKTSQIWKRGNRFFSRISGLCSHYNPLVSTVFEVERQGKKGDTKTEYQFYVSETDNKQLQDFDIVEPENKAFYVKTYDEMKSFLDTGNFPDNRRAVNNSNSTVSTDRQVPVRRRPAVSEEDTF